MKQKAMSAFFGAVLGAAWLTGAATAAETKDHSQHTSSGEGHEGHAGHDHAAPAKSEAYEISRARYVTPSITLTDQYGRPVRVDKLLAENRPMLVQFIFTSCTTICPVMGAVFGGAQADIAAIAPNYRMVSISIDPEYDTPAKLQEFAAKNDAAPDWVFLTGSQSDISAVIKSFDALYQGDNKMYHQPYTFMRWEKDADWVRVRGLMSVADLSAEFAAARGTPK